MIVKSIILRFVCVLAALLLVGGAWAAAPVTPAAPITPAAPAAPSPHDPHYLTADKQIETAADLASHIRFLNGKIHDHAVAGHYAYLAQGRQLSVLNIANPAQPKTIATKVFEETIHSVAAHGNALYLALRGGPIILNITNPAQPTLHASFKLPAEAASVMVLGSILLVDDGEDPGSSLFYDIRDPLHPRFMNQVARTASYATDGTKLFSILTPDRNGASSVTLSIHDISRPGPMLATRHQLPLNDRSLFYVANGEILWGDGGETDIDLSTTATLGLTTTTLGLSNYPAGATTATLHITTSTVTQPKTAARPTTSTATRPKPAVTTAARATTSTATRPKPGARATSSTYAPARFTLAFTTATLRRLASRLGLAPPRLTPTTATTPRLNPGNLRTTSTLAPATSSTLIRAASATSTVTQSIWIHDYLSPDVPDEYFTYERGADLIIAQNLSGFMVFSAANPATPLLSLQRPQAVQQAPQAVRAGTAIYVLRNERVQIFDLSNPDTPQDCGVFPDVARAEAIKVTGALATLQDRERGLLFFDLTNPLEPRLVNTQTTLADARDIRIVRDKAYLADGTGGLKIFDLAGADAPRLIGALRVAGGVDSLEVAGTTLYATTRDKSSMTFIDVANPALPVFRGILKLPEPPLKLALLGDKNLLVADGESGLLIFDITIPTQPWRVGAYVAAAACKDVVCANELACLLTDRLEILNCAQPSRPVRLGQAGASVVAPFADFILLNKQFVYAFTNGPALMHRIDITKPQNPVFITDFIEFNGESYQASMSRPYLFIAWRRATPEGEAHGVDLYDVSLPDRPVRVDSIGRLTTAYSGAVSGRQAFIAAGADGLLVVQLF